MKSVADPVDLLPKIRGHVTGRAIDNGEQPHLFALCLKASRDFVSDMAGLTITSQVVRSLRLFRADQSNTVGGESINGCQFGRRIEAAETILPTKHSRHVVTFDKPFRRTDRGRPEEPLIGFSASGNDQPRWLQSDIAAGLNRECQTFDCWSSKNRCQRQVNGKSGVDL